MRLVKQDTRKRLELWRDAILARKEARANPRHATEGHLEANEQRELDILEALLALDGEK